ncbi:MAG: hypothetical protein IJ299_04845 [Oscillospiraceae bacterium]|nr:hypothetical protein [Oscillospiraceae bacterium]
MTDIKWDFSKIAGFAGKYKYILLVIVAGLLLMVFPSGEKNDSDDHKKESFNLSVFEREVERALSECEGVGRCKVMLSVNSGTENVFANEERESRRKDESMTESDIDTKPSIMSEKSGGETPVLIKELYPEFRGAVVICDGADSAVLREKVSDAVAALTGLRHDRISVIKMKE